MTEGLVFAPPLAWDFDVWQISYIFIAVNMFYKLQLILCWSWGSRAGSGKELCVTGTFLSVDLNERSSLLLKLLFLYIWSSLLGIHHSWLGNATLQQWSIMEKEKGKKKSTLLHSSTQKKQFHKQGQENYIPKYKWTKLIRFSTTANSKSNPKRTFNSYWALNTTRSHLPTSKRANCCMQK